MKIMKQMALISLMGLVSAGCNLKEGDSKTSDQAKANAPKTTATVGDKTTAAKQGASAQASAAKAVAKAADGGKKEVVFDPRNPPPGFTLCHRNHCHREGGGVASYQQVMTEIGATKIIGVPKRQPMPAAPADVASPPADAQKTSSGLASKILKPGSGTATPGPTSVVSVHYTGWTTDGKAFDSSVARGAPATFPLNRVIKGWTEGVQLMKVGEERRFWIPEELAYKGRPGAPQGMLVFDVELLEIK
ncbi:MAG: FKBP-type peptidyl-prolyl cis-trans isomerase [Myxococcota bacterium]|nr:FKBP-type peptidyl-prolyl cis-trans isomerase [Myxococcota bacterium]